MSEKNPFLPIIDEEHRWMNGLVGNDLSDFHAGKLDEWRKALIATGDDEFADDDAVGWMRHQYANPNLIEGLMNIGNGAGFDPTEFIRHSYRYYRWRWTHETFEPPYPPTVNETLGSVALGSHPMNVHVDGRSRRHEEGYTLSLNAVRAAGIDTSRVLFYRVTQPSAGVPKPEYYWTSDSLEVRTGLTYELGRHSETAIVLVSTLEEIAKNGGLIDDINDDQGHAVRQVNFEPFDQERALFSFSRT